MFCLFRPSIYIYYLLFIISIYIHIYDWRFVFAVIIYSLCFSILFTKPSLSSCTISGQIFINILVYIPIGGSRNNVKMQFKRLEIPKPILSAMRFPPLFKVHISPTPSPPSMPKVPPFLLSPCPPPPSTHLCNDARISWRTMLFSLFIDQPFTERICVKLDSRCETYSTPIPSPYSSILLSGSSH